MFFFCLSAALANLNLDFSNVNLKNFKYFRYPTTKAPPIYFLKNLGVYVRPLPPKENPIEKAYKRAVAVYRYTKQLLTGDPLANQRLNFRFDQNVAEMNAPIFQRHYGYRGERLVDLLGRGADLNVLEYYGAIPKRQGKS